MTTEANGNGCWEPPAHRVVELFAGLGGVAAAWPEANIVAAVDIDQHAESTYKANHAARFFRREIQSLTTSDFESWAADCVWLSPPCQPFSRRGARRGMSDRRSAPLSHVIRLLAEVQPRTIVLENVLGFLESDGFNFVSDVLSSAQYQITYQLVCPTHFRWPNRRVRLYLIAHQGRTLPWRSMPLAHPIAPDQSLMRFELRDCPDSSDAADRAGSSFPTSDFIDPVADSCFRAGEDLWVDPIVLERHRPAMDIVTDIDGRFDRPAACFGSSYGRAISRSGSYLSDRGMIRRFSPREVARLLGFTDSFVLPASLTNRQLWKLLGNGLSLPTTRYVLSHLPR